MAGCSLVTVFIRLVVALVAVIVCYIMLNGDLIRTYTMKTSTALKPKPAATAATNRTQSPILPNLNDATNSTTKSLSIQPTKGATVGTGTAPQPKQKKHNAMAAAKNNKKAKAKRQTRLNTSRKKKIGKDMLEFIHIPKTGGSAIEIAAAAKGVTWGMCHFMNMPPQLVVPNHTAADFPGCRRLPPGKVIGRPFCPMPCWHQTPAKFFQNDKPRRNPYYGKSLFVTIRNPYTRMISEYYCPWKGWKKGEQNPETLNAFLQKKLHKYQKTHADDHLFPQTQYVFGSVTKGGPTVQVVDHIIFYENMSAELDELWQNYNLNITLLSEGVNKGRGNQTSRMGVGDLSKETIQLINQVYKTDFGVLGYKLITPRDMVVDGWEKSYSSKSIYMI